MRIPAAQPEAERLIRGLLAEERVKALEGVAGRVARSAARLEAAGGPALAGVPNPVASLLEHVRVGRELARQRAVDVARLLQPPDRLSGQESTTGWAARRRVAEGVGEQDTVACHLVEGGCLDDRVPHRAGMHPRLIVRDAEQDVGGIIRGASLPHQRRRGANSQCRRRQPEKRASRAASLGRGRGILSWGHGACHRPYIVPYGWREPTSSEAEGVSPPLHQSPAGAASRTGPSARRKRRAESSSSNPT